MITRWKLTHTNVTEAAEQFTASFTMQNADTGLETVVALTCARTVPASDMVGACRAVAAILTQHSGVDDVGPDEKVERLN